jgi:RHS repeat-associated protein
MGISGAVTMSYGYDAQGNTTTENNTATYGYDPFNRLSSAGSATDYVGPEGQRLRKITSSGATYFAPDAGGPLLAENSGGGWIDYVWLNGQVIGRIADGEVDAIHHDQTGRPQVVTDASGAVVWKARNYPFEREVALDTIGGLNLGFPGQYYDAERGLWNNGRRDYNASLGRYNESDPAGLVGGVNTYAYVGNNPLSYRDPSGLFPNPAEITCIDPIQPICWAGVAVDIGATAMVLSEIASSHQQKNVHLATPKPGAKPKNCPAGTKPIDQFPGLSKDDIHGIKKGVGAGPSDWTGITPNRDVITGDHEGNSVNNGPLGDYLPGGRQ